jgi:phage terminase small subunit
MRQCWAELGLSPAARGRLEVPEADDEDVTGLFS